MQLEFSLAHESLQEPKQIELTNGEYTLVDDWHYEFLSQWKWYRHPQGYASRHQYRGGEKTILMHRYIMGLEDTRHVDHIDGNKLNNQEHNLRFASQSLNNGNLRKQKTPATSPYKGVYWNKSRQKWYARATYLKKDYWLGQFANEVDAAKAYDKKARDLFGEFARLNFP